LNVNVVFSCGFYFVQGFRYAGLREERWGMRRFPAKAGSFKAKAAKRI
jgi:hypothetical protein